MSGTLQAGVRGTRGALRTELVTDEDEFAALAPAWGRLYSRCAAATPFQSHAWLHSWWLSYGTPAACGFCWSARTASSARPRP